ncbi:MAG: glycosyltransferase family 2 protein [Chloroflexi bacterium]|nr:glycosyltransferase family 2 protein [Chloroflexota bacterium]
MPSDGEARIGPRVAVIVPVWNEEAIVGAVLAEVPTEYRDHVFVVDGGSEDQTRERAAAAGATVIVQRQRGYGAACWEGCQAATPAEILVFLDGDYSDPPAEIPRLVGPIAEGRADLVLGCRRFTPGALPLHARLGNRFVLGIIRLLAGRAPRDLPSFKAVRADRLAGLAMRERTYGWTTEMIVKAIRAGLRIEQVDVEYRQRGGGSSKVSGTVRGTIGASQKLITTAIRYARAPIPDGSIATPRTSRP